MKKRLWIVTATMIMAICMLFTWSIITWAEETEPGTEITETEGETENEGDSGEEQDPGELEPEPVVKTVTELSGQSSYSRKYSFGRKVTLNVKTTGDGILHYTSSNKKVATVNEAGIVTLKGVGCCEITVTAEETEFSEAAEKTVDFRVWKRAKKLTYSSSYKRSKFYKRLKNLELLDDTRDNLVAVAASQLGYHESNSSRDLKGTHKGKRNYNEFGRYYGNNGVPWCAIFVSWVARENGISLAKVPKYCAVRSYYSYFRKRGRIHSWSSVRKRRYLPKPGDIILYSYSRGATTHHIGYVESAEYKFGKFYINTIEGNTDNAVRRVKMKLKKNNTRGKIGGMYITAFASPRYQ